jgi:hypothetical protein
MALIFDILEQLVKFSIKRCELDSLTTGLL